MKKFLKNKTIFFILLALVFSISAVFAYSYFAQDIGFTPADSEWDVDNTKSALDDLYEISKESLSGFSLYFWKTGTIEEVEITTTGYYKLEVWGAQGGSTYKSATDRAQGGYGGYSVGVIRLYKGQKIYVVVGGHPDDASSPSQDYTGGYNGGGNSVHWKNNDCYTGAGGGATHIAMVSGLLSELESNKGNLENDYYVSDDILIVGAGGGGAMSHSSYTVPIVGGSGGGYIGNNGVTNQWQDGSYGGGGTQSEGGESIASPRHNASIPLGGSGSFGQGGNTVSNAAGGAGGGAGFFGGGSGVASDTAAGGSSYIASSKLISGKGITKHMYCYNCTASSITNTETYTISNGTNSCYNSIPTEDCAKAGDGFAKVTYLGKTLS